MADTHRRAVDKATSLPRLTVGFSLLILVSVWYASGLWGSLRDEISTLRVELSDQGQRSGKYIGQTGLYTRQISDARTREVEMCLYLAAKFSDPGFPCT